MMELLWLQHYELTSCWNSASLRRAWKSSAIHAWCCDSREAIRDTTLKLLALDLGLVELEFSQHDILLIPMWLTKHEILSTHHEFDKKDVQGRRRVVVEVIREANASSMHSGHEHLLASIKAQLSPALSKSVVQFHGKGSPSVKIIKIFSVINWIACSHTFVHVQINYMRFFFIFSLQLIWKSWNFLLYFIKNTLLMFDGWLKQDLWFFLMLEFFYIV